MASLFDRLRSPAAEERANQPHRQEDHIAGKILRVLRQNRPDGLNKLAIFNLFYRNQSAANLDAALDKLWQEGKVRREQQVKKPRGGGRPAEIWFATQHD